MQRSLSSGVSGMVNHQMILDTVANNLSNVSTPGFKSSRVSFSTALNQIDFAGSAPGNNLGGRNPEQIGLGVQSGSIDVNMNQGALAATGRAFDLSVQGAGFFQVAKVDAGGNMSGQYYTRVGNFGFDSSNNLVDLSTGLKVMGKQTDAIGNTLGQILPIDITANRAMDAVATQEVTYQGNLSAKAGALQGSSLKSVFPLLEVDPSNKSTVATENTVLSRLSAFNTDSGLNRFTAPTSNTDKTIYVYGTKPNGDAFAGNFVVNPWNETVSDLINKVNRVFTQGNDSFGLATLANGTLTAQGIGNGNGFSMFIGERNPISGNNAASFPSPTTAFAGLTQAGLDTATTPALPAAAIGITTAGRLNPVFSLNAAAVIPLPGLTVTLTKVTAGPVTTTSAVTLPAGNYPAGYTFNLPSESVLVGDTIQYVFSGATSTVNVRSPIDTSGMSTGGVSIAALPALYPPAAHTILPSEAGALDSTFNFPDGTYATLMQVSILVNGQVANTTTLNAGTYAAGSTSLRAQLGSFLNLKAGDTVQFQLTGASPTGGTMPLTVGISSNFRGLTDTAGVDYSGNGVSRVFGSHTVTGTSTSTEAGLLNPTFSIPAGTYGGASGTLKITIKVNGKEVGGVVPTGTFLTPQDYNLSSFPHVKIGDVVTYELSGNKAISNLTWTTGNISDQNSANLTADLNLDGIADMFQEGSTTDVNSWQYEKATNATVNWYKFRMAPDVVASSIQVYDKNGGSHILETRFFRTGTRSVVNSTSVDRYNGWDMMMSIKPEDGVLQDDLVTGLQFDQQGRFIGAANLGTTIHGTALNDANIYVGTPVDNSVTINWATTGTATIKMGLGNANSTTGLTGFGTASTGASINQDGNPNGELQSLSVTQNGNIVGLYSNGKSLPIYQVQVAVFSNPSGLTNAGTNLWSVSSNSGDPIIREPGTAGSGTITAGALEGSNVDIASEFTRLITAQRGFQVNARVIQTTDSMLQELATLIR